MLRYPREKLTQEVRGRSGSGWRIGEISTGRSKGDGEEIQGGYLNHEADRANPYPVHILCLHCQAKDLFQRTEQIKAYCVHQNLVLSNDKDPIVINREK